MKRHRYALFLMNIIITNTFTPNFVHISVSELPLSNSVNYLTCHSKGYFAINVQPY